MSGVHTDTVSLTYSRLLTPIPARAHCTTTAGHHCRHELTRCRACVCSNRDAGALPQSRQEAWAGGVMLGTWAHGMQPKRSAPLQGDKGVAALEPLLASPCILVRRVRAVEMRWHQHTGRGGMARVAWRGARCPQWRCHVHWGSCLTTNHARMPRHALL